MSSAFDFQMYIGPNTQIPQPTDFQTQKIMQWDTDGQENGVKLDPSRPVSGFNALLELRKWSGRWGWYKGVWVVWGSLAV